MSENGPRVAPGGVGACILQQSVSPAVREAQVTVRFGGGTLRMGLGRLCSANGSAMFDRWNYITRGKTALSAVGPGRRG